MGDLKQALSNINRQTGKLVASDDSTSLRRLMIEYRRSAFAEPRPEPVMRRTTGNRRFPSPSPTMSLADILPPSLNLPPHLSAHKYFFVCTLTVAAWDTLVLSPRTWRLLKTEGWPALKIMYHFLRLFVIIEFIIVGGPTYSVY